MASGVMTPMIPVMASLCTARILHAPFFVFLAMLPLLVEVVLGAILLLSLLSIGDKHMC